MGVLNGAGPPPPAAAHVCSTTQPCTGSTLAPLPKRRSSLARGRQRRVHDGLEVLARLRHEDSHNKHKHKHATTATATQKRCQHTHTKAWVVCCSGRASAARHSAGSCVVRCAQCVCACACRAYTKWALRARGRGRARGWCGERRASEMFSSVAAGSIVPSDMMTMRYVLPSKQK